jgi:molecular chaperone GrpE (heat shock protein)
VEEVNDSKNAGKIIEVIQKGYKIGNKVIRPAKVKVGK